ncbi:LuxR C-terminal-related transcriptional regulator [Actinospongicola halichondriae]|uniref:LuxR C-terminal-related transcriptional regulator n=1 Tax=Actinospongicola halichondriae TaxID=3236844 RepID=UPI003D38EF37
MAGPDAGVTATKITPPRPPGRYLRRARLIDLLDSSVDAGRGVVLVSAPAGSGKSTLIDGWLDARSTRAGWLQIDESDNDPAGFWTYVAAALHESVPALPDAVRSAQGDGFDTVVGAVVNEASAAGDEVVLVIDDYHLITNPDVHHSVERLITLRPPNLLLVVSTRVDPPFRLGRLRVRDQLTEIRADDLRFDTDEASWLLDAASTGMRPEAVDRLHRRTEGWAAGLVLAGLSLRGEDDIDGFVDSFQGDDQLVADYLTDEFLDSIDEEERRRLLEVSILDRVSGPQIEQVCGVDDGAAWLSDLASSNQLVIALDRTGTWFRFHHLLQDLLRAELERTAPERGVELHAAAGRWHAESGDLMAAIDHYLQGERHVEAADLVAENATTLLNVGRTYTVTRYIERLSDLVDEHEGLAIVHGWVSFVTGRFAEAERALTIASRLDTDGVDAGLIQALAAMIHLARGDVASGLAAVEVQAPITEPTHPMVLGGVRVMGGRFDEARPYLAQANEMAASHPDYFVAAVTPTFEAVAELEDGHPDAARHLAEASIAFADGHRIGEAPQMALAHSVVAKTTTEPEPAIRSALRGVQLARRSPENVMLVYALASAADVALEHDHSNADSLLDEARSIVNRCVDPGIAGQYLARVEARHGHADRAPADGLVEQLTDRELAVLRYLPSKLTQREIAGELYVSLNTVKTHCRAIYRKLGVDGRKPAVQAARDHDLL